LRGHGDRRCRCACRGVLCNLANPAKTGDGIKTTGGAGQTSANAIVAEAGNHPWLQTNFALAGA
jgi:hypothetical protein